MNDTGDPQGTPRDDLDAQFSDAYEELRRLASVVRRNDPHATITPTVLVNEAWIKLARSPRFRATSPLHFRRIAARAMRQVLIEAARRRQADKRGADAVLVTFDESVQQVASTSDELIELDRALTDLARLNPRQAELVESRFFGGLGVRETADVLGVSEATVERDWRVARAWLASELRN